ncbi:NUDIX domain-containing protein [Nonomuraea sp. H19]|uniref:NUDIX domain-containing protein n=1 Tax=Nonomuraea sp. H19 TaxID=3452206 RepID=UPI003F8C0E90
MAEADEAPAAAAQRELKEELGLDPEIGRLLVVDWVPPHGPWDHSLMFIFDGGILRHQQLAELNVIDRELSILRLADPAEMPELLRLCMAPGSRRTPRALRQTGGVLRRKSLGG